MNYREFVKHAARDIRKYLPEPFRKATIEAADIEKLMGGSYYGLRVISPDEQVGVCINLSGIFAKAEAGSTTEEVLKELAEQIVESFRTRPDLSGVAFADYEEMKQYLMVQVVGTETNSRLLYKVPHKEIEDLSLVYRFFLHSGEDSDASILITDEILCNYEVTASQLHEDAMKNAARNFPYTMKGICEQVSELTGLELEDEEDGMYVVSCNRGHFGAAAIFYPGVMKQIADRLKTGFYVLPSSIHEVLVLGDQTEIPADYLEHMVREINRTELDREDVLSDTVYHYEPETDTFENVRSWITRR